MQAPHSTPQHRSSDLIPAIGSIATLCAAAISLYLFSPLVNRIVPPCPFLWATDCYCPGCGATRAFQSLVRGDFGAAFSYNPLLILALPALGYVYLSFLGGAFFDRELPAPTGLRAWTWVIPVVLVIYWVIRNLPWEPFMYLAP